MKVFIAPHKKVSRPVEEKDLPRVRKDAEDMYLLCQKQHGLNKSAYAVAHAQVEDKDPLQFFVTKDGRIIINPEIKRHTNHLETKEEGCMTFPLERRINVGRYYKCEVNYYTLNADGKLSELIEDQVKGLTAEILQHEIDHFNAKYIYGKEEYKRQTGAWKEQRKAIEKIEKEFAEKRKAAKAESAGSINESDPKRSDSGKDKSHAEVPKEDKKKSRKPTKPTKGGTGVPKVQKANDGSKGTVRKSS